MNTAEQILNAALPEFYQHGFHATGVDQLSACAGVTKRTLYRHFPSKDLLIDAVLQSRDEEFMELMAAFVDAYPTVKRPQAYLDFLAEWGGALDFHGCMFINAAAEYADPSAMPHVQAKAHKARVKDYLKRICREAQLDDPEVFAAQLFLVGEGLIVATQVSGYARTNFELAKRMLGFIA